MSYQKRRVQALQELTTLCQEKDSESVKTVLPFWPRIYSKISMDQDRRVREACQQSHEHLCMKVHRDLAPHLRSLIGAWVLAQCDPYAPASSVAKAAFNAAFPPAKQPAAIAFCKQQIFSMMYENVLTHTPQTLSDPKCTEPEDIESKFLRVVASSLSSLNLLLHSIAVKHADFVEENFSSLLSEGKFWKYAKHSSFPIASAFYSLISSICQLSLPLSVKFADKICPAVLHNLDNSDPVVVAALWECALNALKAIPDCWLRVNPRKGVLPKLWQVMRKGGNGSAAIIHPHFLPLLSLIPTEVKGEGHAFYAEFFGNLKKGLFADGVCRSPREMNAIVKAFVECLKFTFSSAKEDENLRDFLINEVSSFLCVYDD
ncbi:hypothetical protein CAPTEDRAFT_134741 [Capitella teleta]|uniref:E3 ubiquitin-protein ligase listerin n=1 Tax=Capitella teleta TaxID=283909 RepID=R7TN44_CAPTE|nr:hypothetical protein CAPTEDRAFT_134741 [Capitella teleta]|eukprot:ELT92500.1 hypothetical protein CAPTEDRAFT_134741 [Capitella teleta]